jgi:hypothetical protein
MTDLHEKAREVYGQLETPYNESCFLADADTDITRIELALIEVRYEALRQTDEEEIDSAI